MGTPKHPFIHGFTDGWVKAHVYLWPFWAILFVWIIASDVHANPAPFLVVSGLLIVAAAVIGRRLSS